MNQPSALRVILLSALGFWAVQPASPLRAEPGPAAETGTTALGLATLGPGDRIRIDVVDLPELTNRDVVVGADGSISLPLAGRIQAEGLTSEGLEQRIEVELSAVMIEPRASVGVVQAASRPVYVLGAVRKPGELQMRGRMRLLEALSLAGGLTEDSGRELTITRRLERGTLALPGVTTNARSRSSVVQIPVEPLVTSRSPESNVELMPGDVVSVRKADLVYVVGEVEKAGGFVLKDRESVTALKALALAGGLRAHAAAKRAKILRRPGRDEEPEEASVDLKAILDGKAADVPLSPEDVLFIPKSGARSASAKAAEAVLGTLSGILIWRR